MPWAILLAALAAASPSSPPDPEVEILARSLAPSQRAAVEAAVGGLAALPRYRLDVALDAEARTLRGREQIALPPADARDELWLRVPANAAYLDQGLGRAVTIESARANGHPVELVPQDNGVYRVVLDPPATGALLVELELSARVPELKGVATDAATGMGAQAFGMLLGGAGGEARTDYGTFGAWGASYNLAGFAAQLVRREAGVFDSSGEAGIGEPRWGPLGNWLVSLVAPAALTVAGSGVELGQTPEPDGRRRTSRVAAAVRDFALVAGEGLNEQKAKAGEVTVRAFAAPEHALQAKKLLDTAVRALRFYGEKAGAYPWAEYAIVEVPLTAEMEAVAYPMTALVSRLLTEPGNLRRALGPTADGLVDSVLELSLAHQLAHQWWRGIVGSDGRGRPVLDEPLAYYVGLLYVESRRGKAHAKQLQAEQMERAYQLYRTFGYADRAADRPLPEYAGRLEYEALLHAKAGTYYLRLRKLLGDAAFFAALKQSVAANRFKDVDTDPLLLAAAGVAPAKAEAALQLYDRFMRGTKGDEDLGAQLDLAKAAAGAGMQIDPAQMKLLQQALKGLMGGPMPDPPPAQPVKPAPAGKAPPKTGP